MIRTSLKDRKTNDSSFPDCILQERFLDLNLEDWMRYSYSDLDENEYLDKIDELFLFLYEESELSSEARINEFNHLTVCDALRALSNMRADFCISKARSMAFDLLAIGLIKPLSKSKTVDFDCDYDDIPFPD